MGNAVYEFIWQGNRSSWTHTQNRMGKAKIGGMEVGVPWEPRILGLIGFGRLYIGIGEVYIPIHVIYEAEINILGP